MSVICNRLSYIALNDVAYGLPKERWFWSMLLSTCQTRHEILSNTDRNLTELGCGLGKTEIKYFPRECESHPSFIAVI